MRLLITTQAVDVNDPALGFFHTWIEGLSAHFEHVHVVCLKEGEHHLPSNVSVHSLGKSAHDRPASAWEVGRLRLKYIVRFYRYIFSLRREYDAVFVHMNSEYMMLGGVFWRFSGKRAILWRNHVRKDVSTWLGAHAAHAVCYTSPSSYTARFKNAVRMPIGIDTNVFKPATAPAPRNSILFFGRLDEVKHPDIFVQALEILMERLSGLPGQGQEGVSFKADIVGDPTDPASAYAHKVRNRAATLALEGVLAMHASITNAEAPSLYASYAIYVNLTPSGSFDKTIGEAAASGCILVAANNVLRDTLPSALLVNPVSPELVASGIEAALKLSEGERTELSRRLREYVVREHSLALLIERLLGIFKG